MSSNNQGRKSSTNSRRQRAVTVSIQERRRRIAELLQENKSESDIAKLLHCDISTVCNDVKALKEQAITYLYDLCKQDLAFFYHQTIADIDHVRGECWNMYHDSTNKKITPRDRLQALRTIGQLDIARFELLSRGEMVMSVKSLNERINFIKANLGQPTTTEQVIADQQRRTPTV